MALAGNVRSLIVKKLELYEGRVGHLYVDTVGVVTVGVGHALPTPQAALSIPLWSAKNGKPTAPASPDLILKEYKLVASQQRGMVANKYKHTLVLRDGDMNVIRDADVGAFYRELVKKYSVSKGFKHNFDDFPPEAQIALFDMIFNLGGPKLMKKFPKMNGAIQQEDWAEAAKQSNRPQVDPGRNGFVKKQFGAAAGSTTAPMRDNPQIQMRLL